LAIPYELGTAQADAYFAAQDEGKLIWRALIVQGASPLKAKAARESVPAHPAENASNPGSGFSANQQS
jgi:hypothetical protein